MRRLCLAFIAAELAGACGGGLPQGPPPAVVETKRLRVEPRRTWEAAEALLTDQGYTLRRRDRAAGVLETDWHVINPDYNSTLLVTGQDDRYSECGKPGLGRAYGGKEVKLRLEVSPSVRKGETALAVQAVFRTAQYLGLPMAVGQPRGFAFCRSTGWLEDELAVRIQVQAVTDQLDHLRRGAPR
jgi:hypothetical protein